MRPDDIVFVATQPLSLYSRTLSQILGSTGLTSARDTIRNEIETRLTIANNLMIVALWGCGFLTVEIKNFYCIYHF